jgi:hypothetical protein
MMKLLVLPFILLYFSATAQYKSYKLTAKRDTINIVDQNGLKQGRWVSKMPGLRGEPGYDEEGIYRDGKKEGVWRMYTLVGDLYAVERYRWGNKDGISQYYNIAGLMRQESWKAVNPDNPYDTIDVPDLADPNKITRRVIKIEGTAVKHGTWKYFDAATGAITKTDTYFLDKLQDPNAQLFASGQAAAGADTAQVKAKPAAKAKPQAVLDFEKKNAGKKKVKVIDGRTY